MGKGFDKGAGWGKGRGKGNGHYDVEQAARDAAAAVYREHEWWQNDHWHDSTWTGTSSGSADTQQATL